MAQRRVVIPKSAFLLGGDPAILVVADLDGAGRSLTGNCKQIANALIQHRAAAVAA